MREFAYSFSKALQSGLRREVRMPRNSPSLTECFNLKPKKWGLEPYSAITLAISQSELDGKSITVDHPFPQLFRGQKVTLLADATKVYTVDESTWTLTQLTTYDAFDIPTGKAITSGGAWQFMDFGDTWMLFNGNTVVFKMPLYSETLVQDTVSINAGCAHRGRGILAGFNPSALWVGDWNTIWNSYLDNVPVDLEVDHDIPIESNFVMWTTIGGGDLFWMIFPELAVEGIVSEAHDMDQPMLMDYIKRNELGFMPMPWQGTVLAVKPLGKRLMVYGSGGVSVMTPYASPYPTYGLDHLMSVGISGRGAVGGDDKVHVFVDDSGQVWTINAELEMKRLGYKEYIDNIVAEKIVVTYDPQLREFYICGETQGFILTESGMGEMNQLVTSLAVVDDTLKGIFESISDSEARIVSDIVDMDYRAIKTFESVEVGLDTSTVVKAAIDYRYKKSESFTRTPFITLNDEGVARLTTSGLEFRLALKATNYADVNIDYLVGKWKLSDKRYTRGPNVITPNR